MHMHAYAGGTKTHSSPSHSALDSRLVAEVIDNFMKVPVPGAELKTSHASKTQRIHK